MYFPNHLGLLEFHEMISVLYFCSVRDSLALFTTLLPIFSSSFNGNTKKIIRKTRFIRHLMDFFLKMKTVTKKKVLLNFYLF